MVEQPTGGAKLARVTERVSVPFGGERFEVLTAEGFVQIVLISDGWPDGSRPRGPNVFCNADTARECRALADEIERQIAVVERGFVQGAAE